MIGEGYNPYTATAAESAYHDAILYTPPIEICANDLNVDDNLVVIVEIPYVDSEGNSVDAKGKRYYYPSTMDMRCTEICDKGDRAIALLTHEEFISGGLWPDSIEMLMGTSIKSFLLVNNSGQLYLQDNEEKLYPVINIKRQQNRSRQIIEN